MWLEKELSQEEKSLFQYLDSVSASQNSISLFDKNIYKEYTLSLNNLCKKLDINYFDSNKILKGKLTKNDYRVTVITRNIHQKSYIIKTQANAGYIDIVEANIFDEGKIRKLFKIIIGFLFINYFCPTLYCNFSF